MSHNITAAVTRYAPELYFANIDLNSLGWMEKQWATWYILIGNPIIATGLMSFLLHEVCPFPHVRRRACVLTGRRLCTLAGVSPGL